MGGFVNQSVRPGSGSDSNMRTSQDLAPKWMEDFTDQRDHPYYFVIFIFGNFRLTAATTSACSGFPELLARASRA